MRSRGMEGVEGSPAQRQALVTMASAASLVSSAARKRIGPRVTLLRIGREPDLVCVLYRGWAKLVIEDERGRPFTASVSGPGEVVHAGALLLERSEAARVVTLEPCDAVVLPRIELQRISTGDEPFAYALWHAEAAQADRLLARICDQRTCVAERRLARLFFNLLRRFGRSPYSSGIRIQPRLSQQEIADLIGVSRVLGNRLLRKWHHAQIASHERGIVTVHDLSRLAQISGLQASENEIV